MRFAFIESEKASFPVAFMCRHLSVTKSGFSGRIFCDGCRTCHGTGTR